MKTRIMTNKDRSSYRVDIMDEGDLTSHYFITEKEAKEFQSFTINVDKYKQFI
mgnify:CR=1 FL=1